MCVLVADVHVVACFLTLLQFVEAREELELANESLGTVYFNEEMEGAQVRTAQCAAAASLYSLRGCLL